VGVGFGGVVVGFGGVVVGFGGLVIVTVTGAVTVTTVPHRTSSGFIQQQPSPTGDLCLPRRFSKQSAIQLDLLLYLWA